MTQVIVGNFNKLCVTTKQQQQQKQKTKLCVRKDHQHSLRVIKIVQAHLTTTKIKDTHTHSRSQFNVLNSLITIVIVL